MKMKKYAIWNNKGGVGKTFLSFIISTEYAINNPDQKVLVADMCPQANLSEIMLGGNSKGSSNLEKILDARDRKTIGGYFDLRIREPHNIIGRESDYAIQVSDYNSELPTNLYLLCGDPSLEIQAQVMNQIGSQTLPQDSWKNVHNWLRDLMLVNSEKFGSTINFIDCNPSFSAYTELAMIAADRLIIPCSSDGSSARAISNVASLVYGIGENDAISQVSFSAQAKKFGLSLPLIHTVILNRSTQYNKQASKAFAAMFDNIKKRVNDLYARSSKSFTSGSGNYFEDMPDNHSVAIVCSYYGRPLSKITVGPYEIHEIKAQVNKEPLERYKGAINNLIKNI
jgi:chromosome partitioning protein